MPIYVKLGSISGDASIQTKGYEVGADGKAKWFIAESFNFGVEREMKESGDKGGTEDINIGIGSLNECSVSKSIDFASPLLAQYAVNGNSPGDAEINFVEVAGPGEGTASVASGPLCYLKVVLGRVFVKSWSIQGDGDQRPTEEVAFYYNKIAFQYARTPDGKEFSYSPLMSWNNATNELWDENKIATLGSGGFKQMVTG
ncbi:MAG: type VI secretion system tube protein Hcp [Lacipirellulaceae bacterium]